MINLSFLCWYHGIAQAFVSHGSTAVAREKSMHENGAWYITTEMEANQGCESHRDSQQQSLRDGLNFSFD